MKVAAKTKADLTKEIDELRARLKETEKKLFTISEAQDRSSEVTARLVLDQATDIIIVCDPMGRITQSSEVTHRYFGARLLLRSFDAIVKLRFSLTHSLRKAEFSVSEVLNGKIFRKEEVLLQGEGKAFHFLLSARPLTDRHERIQGCVVTLTDITERKQMELELARFASFPQLNPNPVVEVDLAGQVQYSNAAAERLFPDLGEAGSDHPWLTDLEKISDLLKTGARKATVRELRVGDRWYQQTIHPVTEGTRLRIYGFDVTERMQAAEAVCESERDLNRAQAVAHTGSWRLDVRRNELLWSDETHRMFGIPRKTPLTYEAFLATVHPEDRQRVDQLWQAALRGEPYDVEHRILVGGKIKWVRERAELEFDNEGSLTGGFGTVHDITERKHSDQERERLRIEAETERRRLEAIMEALPVGVSITDEHGGNIRANRAFEQVWGGPRPKTASVSDYTAYKAWWVDSGRPVAPEEWASAQAVQKGRTVVGQLLEIQRFDGSRAFVINSGAPVFDVNGKIVGSAVAIQDITAHREAQMKYAKILATAFSGFWIADPQGRLLEVNDALCRMLGYTREELLARSIADVEADESPADVMSHIVALQRKRSDFFVSRHRRKDGSFIDVEVNSTWLDIGEGQLVCFMRDITERKRAEEALRTSLQRYRSYIEVTGELGWTTNADGEVVEDIPFFRKFTGQTEEEVKGWGWSKALHPDDLEHTTRIWNQAVNSKSNYEIEYRLRRHDGIYRHFLARGVPVFKEDGVIREWVGTCIDITERKQMEGELRKSRDELEIKVQERTKEVREQARVLDSFFKFSITPFVILDKTFNFIRVNEAYAKAGRREVSEFPGHNHFEFYPSDAKVKFEEVVRTKQPYVASARPFSFPDHPEWGLTYWDWILTPILNDAREVEYLVFSLEDVTNRKQAEETIKRERRRFFDVLEMLPAYLVLLTPDYHVPFANRFFRERFGESHGHRCFEYLFGRSEPCEICETYTVLRTIAPHQWERTGPDSHIYDVFDFPFTETDGSILILEMGIDITERKRAEQALRAAHQYNRSLIEASLDPLVMINAEGKVTDVNSATELATGVIREQLIGSDFSDYFTEPERAREGYRTAFSKGTVRDYPLAIRHRSGIITDVLYNATIYRNEAGEIQGVFAAARDITERKRAEEALKESEGRLRVLSAQLLTAQESERKRIALELHDGVGQMLTAVKFKAENTIQEMGKGKAHQKSKSLEALVPMIKDTIEEVRRMQMDLRPSTLDDLGVLATLGWFCREYQKIYSRIHVEKEIGVEENEISLPRKVVIYRLTQEAMNNIAKHSRADLVRLSLGKQGDRIEWRIEDNGTGFDLEEILSSAESKRGLGLGSMKERAELSGGTFEIESTEGKGTTLRASWPI